ncbi:MAG: 2-polyprenyl-3-methyl-5-hydroxy-6-metoxy-1,4-benzoquinol methylase [Mariniblastus sp.]|jgi:2-polyprenyl-3-methyl-5-hydroxy-6-metoxy-1,4-benzoquinol methylase
MPDYREIYNNVFSTDERYHLAQNSPGLRATIQATDRLSMLSGRSLDIGCGVGFVLEYLSGPSFRFNAFGVDVSDQAIEKSKSRMNHIPGAIQRIQRLASEELPFEDRWFSLITCFDVLEHLDEPDIDRLLAEVKRTLHSQGMFFCSVSCRTSGVLDINGENLHRTVKSTDWWLERIKPEWAEYDGIRKQLSMWMRLPSLD